MPKLLRNALSAQQVRHAGPGSHVDGNGLMLRVRASGTRQWIQRLTIHGRRVDLGLGSAACDRMMVPLIEELNATATIYPGTELRLFYELAGDPLPDVSPDSGSGQEV